MNLSLFNTASLFDAATDLFSQLKIKLNSNTAEPLPVREVLKSFYKDNDTFNSIKQTFYIGTLDNTVFSATGMFDESYSYKQALQQAAKNYEGLMLFALALSWSLGRGSYDGHRSQISYRDNCGKENQDCDPCKIKSKGCNFCKTSVRKKIANAS